MLYALNVYDFFCQLYLVESELKLKKIAVTENSNNKVEEYFWVVQRHSGNADSDLSHFKDTFPSGCLVMQCAAFS